MRRKLTEIWQPKHYRKLNHLSNPILLDVLAWKEFSNFQVRSFILGVSLSQKIKTKLPDAT
jgi:hypothetical protein